MAFFHVCMFVPFEEVHVLAGYNEVIETIVWGLNNMGHHASSGINEIKPDATNIVFGAHNLNITTLKWLGPNTIIYNLEQIHGLYTVQHQEENLLHFKNVLDWAAEHLTVWDYSLRNVEAVKAHSPHANIHHVPISYAPVLSRIPKAETQDIDLLLVGMPHSYRLEAFQELAEHWFSSVFVCGLYGKGRDGLISRSKIVLNITGGASDAIFPIVRASYLLANAKLLIADLSPDLYIEPDIREAVAFVRREHLVRACKHFLTNDTDRAKMEMRGFTVIRQRDIRTALAAALGDSYGPVSPPSPTEEAS